jgi:branched-subunit amino acid transport protein
VIQPDVVFWVIILAGLFTFGIKFLFIALAGKVELPVQIQHALQFVPVAVLTALVIPAILSPHHALDLSTGNPKLISGIFAFVAAKYTKNVLLTLAVGMGGLWLFQMIAGLQKKCNYQVS